MLVNKNIIFWITVSFLYALSIFVTYYKVYVLRDYPIFLEEKDIPEPFDYIAEFKINLIIK